MPSLIQLLANVAQTAIEPFLLAHRVASRVRSDDGEQNSYEGCIFFSARSRPPPGRRWREEEWSAKPSSSSCRPRRMVLRSMPVICERSLSLGWEGSAESEPRYQRRCGSER